jgi:hypothetical protein
LINKIYKETFKEDIPAVLLKQEQQVIDLFYDNFANKAARKSFTNKTRFHILYWFLSESYSELSENGITSGSYIDFNINKGKFEVIDDKILYSCLIALKNKLENRYDLKTTNYPSWFKKESYWGFKNSLEKLLSKDIFHTSIFKGRPNGVPVIKNQLDAINLVKGSMSKEAVEKIIDTIFKLNPGARNSRFRNYNSVVKLSERLYEEAKFAFYSKNSHMLGSSQLDIEWVKLRVTKKKCLKYILYWGAISTLQQYHKKHLEVSSKREVAFFSHAYSVLRAGLVNMKLLKCTDLTFCPGVRSRSWETKVMLAIGQGIKPYKFSLNNVELQYSKILRYNDKETFAAKRSVYASKYLPDKIEAFERYEHFKQAGKNTGYHSFMAYKLFADDPYMQKKSIDEADLSRMEKSKYANFVVKFQLKYSSVEAYDWHYEGRDAAI